MLQKYSVAILVVGFLLTREGFSQCFTRTNCTGDILLPPENNSRACCVGTNDGLSFSNGSCTLCIVHGFAKAVYDVVEEERVDSMFQLNVKGQTGLGPALVIEGTINAMADGTADRSDFEELRPIAVQNSAARIRLFTTNDEITLEYDDSVKLTFTPDNRALIDGLEDAGEYLRDSAIVNIIDNDQLQINFEESDYSITEGSGLSTPIRLQFRQNQNPFTITFSPVTIGTAEERGLGSFIDSNMTEEESRATAGEDFTDMTRTVTVPANRVQYVIPEFFTIIDDNIDEIEQSFALAAELGPDVLGIPDHPTSFSCFQTQVGETVCFGRSGATEIRITDNDPMIIGFTMRGQNISEADAPMNIELFQLTIDVATDRTSEREYLMRFRYQESSSTATVEPLISENNISDALFGSRDRPDDPIVVTRVLGPGDNTILPLRTIIRNDFRPEPRECYTIAILTTDIDGIRELFTCNDGENATDFFCDHTICIDNDDKPFLVAFVQTTYTVVESEGSVEVCVNLTRPEIDILEETVRVDVISNESSIYIPDGARLGTPDMPDFLGRYSMLDGTDYTNQTSAFNSIDDELITAVMRMVCYNQTIYDDMRLEKSEYAGLTLGVDMATVLTYVQDPYNFSAIHIVDDDMAVVGLERTFYNVSEDVVVVIVCAVVTFPTINCPIEFPFNVRLSTTDGTAVSPMDYGAVSTLLMFDTCDTRQCTEITIVDDDTLENVEDLSFTLERTQDLDDKIDLDPVNGIIEITDNDMAVVGLERTIYTVPEDEGVVELCAVVYSPDITCPIDFPFVVNLTTSDDSATSPMDYSAGSTLLMFDRCERRRCVNVSIVDDITLENIESFIVTLERTAGLDGRITLDPVDGVVRINDNDDAVVGLEQTFYQVSENMGVVEVCTVVFQPDISCPIAFPFTVDFTSTDNSADSPEDYGDSDTTLMFPACERSRCVNIPIVNDGVIEPPERFDIAIRRTVDLDSRIQLDPTDGEVEIIDGDNMAVVGLEMTFYSVSEGMGTVEVCAIVISPNGNIMCPIDIPFNVTISSMERSAMSPMDYSDISQILAFDRCERRRCTRVPIVDDMTLEDIEFFDLTLNRTPGLDSGITLDPVDGVVQINDNDDAVVGLERTVYQVSEGDGVVEVCTVVIQPDTSVDCPISFPFTVDFNSTDNSANAPGDYGDEDTTLMFAACQRKQCVNISIVDDEVLELTEEFDVAIRRTADLDSRIRLEPMDGVIEIDDDGDAVVGLERTFYTASEGVDPSVEVCIVVYQPRNIPCPIIFPFDVRLFTSDNTAVVVQDYTAVNEVVRFPACSRRECRTVPIINDATPEETELLDITLERTLGLTSGIILDPVNAMIQIVDTAPPPLLVNDTLTGDPLFTVPIHTDMDVMQGDIITSLCYEVHGEADKFFNLVSDTGVSVNAHYARASTGNPNITLNVVDAIGVKAVSSANTVVNISVRLEGCQATVDGVAITGMYQMNGITVRKYTRRVRIVVPNCVHMDLVMWVFCTSGQTEDPFTWVSYDFNFIRFVVMRGLNLAEESHGLIGQFWNVPVDVIEHTGLFHGVELDYDYNITVHHPGNPPDNLPTQRSFVGLRSSVTWEFEQRPCLYVGNSQAGPLGEDVVPNDSVIEGTYRDYEVESMFAPEYRFSHFNEATCMN